MSVNMSEIDSVAHAEHTKSGDGLNFEALNISTGQGTQNNYHQTGSGNVQYNATTQTFPHTPANLEELKNEKIVACQNALVDIPPEHHRAALISAKGNRVDGTWEWITNDREYQSLLRGETQLLWIQGGPGKGKTMLSIFLTQHLEQVHKVIYFFCQADGETRRSATYVLRSLLWQISYQQPTTAWHLIQYLYPPEQKQAALSFRETLWSIFLKMTKDSRLTTMFCVIDGLDECDEDSRGWLASKLVKLCNSRTTESQDGLRVMVISRPHLSVLRSSRSIILDPDNSRQISRDIQAFVKTKVEELSNQLGSISDKTRNDFKSRMQTGLSSRAEGTFLWVGFAMIELLKLSTWTQMEAAICQLPKGLPALYHRMLLQIEPPHRSTSSKILHWIAVAARPLTIDEIGVVIGAGTHGSVPVEQHTLDQLSICRPFITILRRTATLVHDSAREYLLLTRDDFYMDLSSVHLEIATTCLASIERRYEDFDSITKSKPGGHCANVSLDPLFCYAMVHWVEHAREAGEDFKPLAASAPLFFAKKSHSRNRWAREFCTKNLSQDIFKDAHNYPHQKPVLYEASYLGITSWVAKLLRSRVNRTNKHGLNCSLRNAAMKGHIAVVKLLLRHRARVNAHGPWTPLRLAVSAGHLGVVRLLLEYGVNIEKENVTEPRILHVAVLLGNAAMVRILLEHTPDVNSNGLFRHAGTTYFPHSWCASLHFASHQGNVDVIQVLLQKGAHVNARDARRETPIYFAIRGNSGRAVELLLQNGAMIDAGSKFGDTALHIAARYATRSQLWSLLLQAGAEVNARSNAGETPLQLAIRCPYLSSQNWSLHIGSFVGALLRAGAEANAASKDGKTPLHWAATRLKAEAAKILLDYGAHGMVNATDIAGRTPLHIAIETLQEESSLRLIYPINNQEQFKRVMVKGWELVTTLLDHDADINARDHSGKIPSDYTQHKPNAKMLRELAARPEVSASRRARISDDIIEIGDNIFESHG